MFKNIVSIIFLSSLATCSTGPTAYGPVGNTDFGYHNTQLQSDRFKVSYTGRSYTEVEELSLLRAAELTLREGYSHFEIIGDEGWDNGQRPRVPVGVVVGGYGGDPRIGAGVEDVIRLAEGDKVTRTIEIVMLNSVAQKTPNVYDAKQLTQFIKPAVFQ